MLENLAGRKLRFFGNDSLPYMAAAVGREEMDRCDCRVVMHQGQIQPIERM
jgi:hypothetical protein